MVFFEWSSIQSSLINDDLLIKTKGQIELVFTNQVATLTIKVKNDETLYSNSTERLIVHKVFFQ